MNTSKQTPQQRYDEKRKGQPRIAPIFTTQDVIEKLDALAEAHGSRKAVIELAICKLFTESACTNK